METEAYVDRLNDKKNSKGLEVNFLYIVIEDYKSYGHDSFNNKRCLTIYSKV
jgi:hypothetical protein